ncbi:MAG: ImmA/IrrE family metallo-endopeptidase [Chloroflexi bacterium]|nr:ImmA/IrrE family metallo-endopeptidase [Chloroflexota bacterium]
MVTTFLSDVQLENSAARLLGRHEALYGEVDCPPVPVEDILEDVLDLSILWDTIQEEPDQSILAELNPDSRRVVFNEARQDLITETPGLYQTILGHEAGHWEVHVDKGQVHQLALSGMEPSVKCLYRSSGPGQAPQEIQAHRFMGFLLMPSRLLFEAIRDVDLLSWRELYSLREEFQVTITALKVRLERLGLLYISKDGLLYPSRQEYEGQIRLS